MRSFFNFGLVVQGESTGEAALFPASLMRSPHEKL
jgi:hypothetical protein